MPPIKKIPQCERLTACTFGTETNIQHPFLPPFEGLDIGFIGLLGFFAMWIS
jgi:hypothetical protein